MNGLIPIVIEPYPDELLYSWIIRLANANELSPSIFVETYFTTKINSNKIPVDIRNGYCNFYEALNCDIDKMDLYFQLSTTKFELSFYPAKHHIKIFNNVLRKEGNLNTINNYFIQVPRMCMECMKEDVDEYGEFYIHRSHQLSGVCVCHKHQTPLYIPAISHKSNQQFDFSNLTKVIDTVSISDYEYSKYVYQLLNKLETNIDILFDVISNKVREKLGKESLSKQEMAQYIAHILNEPKKEKEIMTTNKHVDAQYIIKVLMELFPNVNDLLSIVPSYQMIMKEYCSLCNRDYYITPQAISDGWGCVYCDDENEEELIKRLVKNIGKDQFVFKEIKNEKIKKLVVYHKDFGTEFSTKLINFLFKDASFYFTNIMSIKEANERMKKYKNFKLIEFSGVANPAKIRHELCGAIMEFDKFNHFERNPVCKCCEQHHYFSLEYFKQQVKEIVGDEYEVVGKSDKMLHGQHVVKIKHNKCGEVREYKTRDFLLGKHCPNCKLKVSEEDISNTLEKYSDGRYSIIGRHHHYVKIIDRKANEEFLLKRQFLLQEMLRPTPSPIIELKEQIKEIEATDLWNMYYDLCTEYKKEFGHLYVNRKEKYKNQSIGLWCDTQKCLYNKGELPQDRIQKLKDIDFVFDGNFYLWSKRFEEYKDFMNETGRIAPKHGEVHNGNKVGSWFFVQRHHKLKGMLSDEQIRLLLEFNPKFFDELPKGKQN